MCWASGAVSPAEEPDRHGGDQPERPGDEAQGHRGEQLPVLVLERRQRVDPQEGRPRNGKVDRERDRGRQQRPDQRCREAGGLRTRQLEHQNRRQQRGRQQAAVGRRHPGQRVRRSHLVAELPALRDPRSQPAAHPPQRVLRPEARATRQRHQRHGNPLQDRGRLDALLLQLLDRAGQLVREPKDAPQHTDEHPGPRGHRHPPQAPVQPTGILREREPELCPALDQAPRTPGPRTRARPRTPPRTASAARSPVTARWRRRRRPTVTPGRSREASPRSRTTDRHRGRQQAKPPTRVSAPHRARADAPLHGPDATRGAQPTAGRVGRAGRDSARGRHVQPTTLAPCVHSG